MYADKHDAVHGRTPAWMKHKGNTWMTNLPGSTPHIVAYPAGGGQRQTNAERLAVIEERIVTLERKVAGSKNP
jgi:hypothetical protein